MYLFKPTQFKVKVEMRPVKLTSCIKIELSAIIVNHLLLPRFLTDISQPAGCIASGLEISTAVSITK